MIDLGIRLIIDKENNKSYISIDGDIAKASEKEKIEVRDTLVEAFSKILGVKNKEESEAVTPQINNDFEKQERKPLKFIEEAIEETQEKSEEENKNWKKEFKNQEGIKLGWGKYKQYTAFEVLEKFGEEGMKELNSLKKIFSRNVDRYPKNKKKIDEIDRAIELYSHMAS